MNELEEMIVEIALTGLVRTRIGHGPREIVSLQVSPCPHIRLFHTLSDMMPKVAIYNIN
jgi:hypothetical protein